MLYNGRYFRLKVNWLLGNGQPPIVMLNKVKHPYGATIVKILSLGCVAERDSSLRSERQLC